MSRLSQVMGDSLIVRGYIPAELVDRYDRVTEQAMRWAACEDAREAVAEAEEDSRPLAEVLELHGFSRAVPDGGAA